MMPENIDITYFARGADPPIHSSVQAGTTFRLWNRHTDSPFFIGTFHNVAPTIIKLVRELKQVDNVCAATKRTNSDKTSQRLRILAAMRLTQEEIDEYEANYSLRIKLGNQVFKKLIEQFDNDVLDIFACANWELFADHLSNRAHMHASGKLHIQDNNCFKLELVRVYATHVFDTPEAEALFALEHQ